MPLSFLSHHAELDERRAFCWCFRVLKSQGFAAGILPLEELNMYFLRPRDMVVKLALVLQDLCNAQIFGAPADCLDSNLSGQFPPHFG